MGSNVYEHAYRHTNTCWDKRYEHAYPHANTRWDNFISYNQRYMNMHIVHYNMHIVTLIHVGTIL